MSGREWKPGDVALRVGHFGRHVALRVNQCSGASLGHLEHWHFVDPDVKETQCGSDFSGVAEYRPLVVIDPEDREQIERLVKSRWKGGDWINDRVINKWQAALRSLIEPPRPPEPTGLGAVVEDVNGTKWIRHDSVPISKPWINTDDCSTRLAAWADIAAVKVLSEGVTP